MNQNIQRTVNPLTSPPAARPMPASAPADAMTPKEILGIIQRHLLMIVLFTASGLVLGAALFFVLSRFSPKYSALAAIEVLPPVEGDPLTFNIAQPQKDTYYQHRFTKAAYFKQQDMMQELCRLEEIQNTGWFKKFARVDNNGNIIGDKDKAMKKAVKDLQDNLTATAPRDFIFLEIRMTCGNPKEAAKIVNRAVELFLSRQRNLALGSISSDLAEKTAQRDAIRARLDTIEQTLANIRSGTRFSRLNITENTTFRDYMDDKMANIEQSFSALDSQKSNLETQIETLKKRAFGEIFDDVVRDQIEQDPIARQIRANIAATEPILAERLSRFGPEHRSVIETQDSLKTMKEDLVKRQDFIGDVVRKSQYQSAEDQRAALLQQLDTITKQLQAAQTEYKDIDRIRAEYGKYEDKRQEELKLLNEMNGYIEKLNAIYSDPVIAKLRSLGTAPEPLEPSFPMWQLFLPGGFILGLLAGIGLAFAVELMNDLLRTPSEVMRHLRIPLLGSICHVDDDRDIEGVDLNHVVRQAPYSITSECYRQLRTNLKLSGPGAATYKSMLITSPSAGDGKTAIAVNLAGTILSESKKVLLIDANFRRPSMGNLFPRTESNGSVSEHADFGLSNYLMGQCSDIKDIIRPSGIEGLDIIDSGPLPANPADLLDNPRMIQILEQSKQFYDFVITDGPALLVTDAKILASRCDCTLVVFNAASTHRGTAQRVLRELNNAHANTVGTVLMAVKSRKGGYFKEIYRSYQEYQRVQLNQTF